MKKEVKLRTETPFKITFEKFPTNWPKKMKRRPNSEGGECE